MLLVLAFSSRSLAVDFRGEVIGVDGCVHVIDADGKRRPVEQAGERLREMDTVVTEEGGNAIVQLDDGVLSVLSEKSRLRVEKTHWLSHLGGQIYFTFRKVFSGSRQVKTRFATLGIRGTTFIVYDDIDGQSVALQEGSLGVESVADAFEMHRQQQLEDFDAFRQEVMQQKEQLHREFDDYKKGQAQAFIEYKNSFILQPDRVIRFTGVRVDEAPLDDEIEADFGNFEAIAGELLDEFRERSRQHREQLDSKPVIDEDDFYE